MGRVKKTIMTSLFILVSALMSKTTKAGDTTLVERFDLMAEKLDRTEMQTSILYNRVFTFAKLNKQLFKQEERDSIQRDYHYWKQIYLEMYNADYDKDQKLNFDAYTSKVKQYVIRNSKIPIGIIHYNFEYIDSNAYTDGRIKELDKQLIRTKTNPQSPFLLDQVTNLSILSNHIFSGKQTFVFDKSFVFSNTEEKIEFIKIDFENDDQPEYVLKYGDSLLCDFNTIGKNTFRYTIVYSSSETYTSESSFTVLSSGTAPCDFKQGITTATFNDFSSFVAGCTYEFGLYYSKCTNTVSEKLTKPILVLDGFDPGEVRKVGNIYDLMNEQPVKLADFLRAEGHDLIVCNFPDGADYIERNALGVIQLLEYINARTTDKVMIVGPSMGGLIAKYALAKMEKDNIPHNVGTYLSFDAPHQGANVPIGAQYFLHFFGEIIGEAGALEGLNKIKSPAAREMLIHYYFPFSVNPQSHNFRSRYLINCSTNSLAGSNGYPTKTRNVALINGSETKQTQGISGLLFSLNIGIFGNALNAARGNVYASPNSGTAVVADLRAINPNNFYQLETYVRQASVILNNPYPTSLDNAPGGRYDTQYQLTHSNGVLRSGFTLYHAHHNFIPSVSALDIKYADGHTNYMFGIKDAKILCNKLTPFVSYYAPEPNEAHVLITQNNSAWLKRELKNGTRTVHASSETKVIRAGKNFNYGVNTQDFYIESFEVKDDGVLGINIHELTGYNNEARPARNSNFVVDGYNVKCDPITIKVSNRGIIKIGHWGYSNGELRISENSILHLDDLAKLEVFNTSKLVIEKGSKLIIGKNVDINLFDNNSIIIIEGTLEIEDDAILSFTGAGQLHIKTTDIILGKNSKIKLLGSGKNDVVLSIEDGKNIGFPFTLNSNNLFEVKNGQIDLLGTASYINSAIATSLINCTINGGNGIFLNGQADVQIQSCTFSNNKHGITGYLTNIESYNIVGNPLVVESCEFNNNEIAIRVFGKGFDLRNVMSNNCKKVITADAMNITSYITNCTFTGSNLQTTFPFNNAAVQFVSNSNTSLTIFNTYINNYNVGVYASQSILNLNCSEILDANYYSVWVANNAMLNMSPAANAGSNTLSVKARLNNRTICLENASNINIANGFNSFKIDADQNNFFVAGTMTNIPNAINFKGNNWYTRINSNTFLNPPSQKFYFVSLNAAPSSARIKNFLVAPVMAFASTNGCALAGQGTGLPIIDSTKVQEANENLDNKSINLYIENQEKYNRLVEQAQLKCNMGLFEQALQEYRNALKYVDNASTENHLNYWTCITEAKIKISRNSYSIQQIDSILTECPEINKYKNEPDLLNNINQENNMKKEEVTLMPNPTNGLFEVLLNDENSKIYSVSIFSLQGKLLKEVAISQSPSLVKLSLKGYSPGMYLVHVKTSKSELIKKIVLTAEK